MLSLLGFGSKKKKKAGGKGARRDSSTPLSTVKTTAQRGTHQEMILDKAEFWSRLDEVAEAEAQRCNDAAEREKMDVEIREAQHFCYPKKIKPRSQYGIGGRTQYSPPRWVLPQDEEVGDALKALKVKSQLGARAGRLAELLEQNVLDVNPEPPIFVKLQPYNLGKGSPLLCDLERPDMHVYKNEASFISVVEVGYSKTTLTKTIDSSKLDVVVANGVRLNITELCRCMPRIRSLGLALNQLGTQIAPLSLWVKGNEKLERLMITNNKLDDQGAMELAQSLCQTTTLQYLKLTEGKINDMGAQAIADSLVPCQCKAMVETFGREGQVDLLEVAINHGFDDVVSILFQAAQCGASKTIKFILKKYPNLRDFFNGQGRTPLMEAAIAGQVGSVSTLLKNKASLDKKDPDGRTVVQVAAHRGQNSVLHFLLEPWRQHSPDLETPLLIHFQIEAVKTLRNMNSGPDDLEDDPDEPAQKVKASLRDRAAKKIILGFGGQVEKKKAGNMTRSIEVFFEVSMGAGEKKVTSPFLVPALSDVTNMHLRLPFPVKTYGTNTVVDIKVCSIGDDEEARTLGYCHVDISTLLQKHPEAAPFWAQIFWKSDIPVGWLRLSAHAVWMYLEQESIFGTTPLLDAAAAGHTAVVETLITNGADIDTTDPDNNTPLIAAVWGGHKDVMNLCLKYHSELDATNRKGVSAMIAAERKEWHHMIPLIQMHLRVARGLPIDIKGWTAATIRPMTPMDGPSPPKTPGTPINGTRIQRTESELENKYKEQRRKVVLEKLVSEKPSELDFLKSMYRGEFIDSRLDIELVRAVDLPRADILGLSDPYIKLHLNGIVYKTNVKKNTLDPVWEEIVIFDDQKRGIWREQKLMVEIFDWNRVGSEKLLGRLAIEIQDLEQLQDGEEGAEEWFFLNDEEGNQVYGESMAEKERMKKQLQKSKKAHKNLLMGESGGDLLVESTETSFREKRGAAKDKPQPSQLLMRWKFNPGAGKYVMFRIRKGLHFPKKKKGKLPDLQAWIESNSHAAYSDVQKATTSPEFEWEARLPTRTNDTDISITIRQENEKDATLPGQFVARISMTTGQVETLVQGGLTQGWIELQDEAGARLCDEDGAATMLLIQFGIWTKKSETDHSDEWAIHAPPPDPRPPARLSPEAWITSQALKHTLNSVGWARDAYTRYSQKLSLDPFEDQDDAPETLLDVEGFRSLMLELGRSINPLEAVKIFHEHSTFKVPANGCVWPDLCAILGFSRETALHGEEFQQQDLKEIVVNGHCLPKIGLRVVLREDAKEKFPDLVKDSADGPGTIYYVDHSMDGDMEASKNKPHLKGLVSHVQWDRTGKRADYRTGYMGAYRLRVYVPESAVHAEELNQLFTNHKLCSVRTLDLSHNQISNAGATSISEALALNHTIESLCLAYNRIGRPGGIALGTMIASNRIIRNLDLESNRVQDEGLFTLCDALKATNAVLQVLVLNDNELTAKCCNLLAKSFITNVSIKSLSLAKNGLGGDGANILAEGVRISKSILRLDVSANALGSRGFEKLVSGLKLKPGKLGKPARPGNNTLEYLASRGNNVTDDVLENLSVVLQGHKQIVDIDLRDNPLSDECQKTIREILEEKTWHFKCEKYAIKLQKIWRGILTRSRAVKTDKPWTTLRKHVFSIEDITVEQDPNLWAKNAFLKHQIPGKGLSAAGLQSIIQQLGRDTSEAACSDLIVEHCGKDATMMQWSGFCDLMQIDPIILESHAEAIGYVQAEDGSWYDPSVNEDESYSHTYDASGSSDEDTHRSKPGYQSSLTAFEGSTHRDAFPEQEAQPVLFLGWDGDHNDELDRYGLLIEAGEMLKSIRNDLHKLDSDGQEDDNEKIHDVEMLEMRADQILRDAEQATMSAITARNFDIGKRPTNEVAASAVQGMASSLDRYEELERLLEAPDADQEVINRLVRELEDVQIETLRNLETTEIEAQLDMLRKGHSLDMEDETEDSALSEDNPDFKANVDKAYSELQAALESESQDINAISRALEEFDCARSVALRKSIALRGPEPSLSRQGARPGNQVSFTEEPENHTEPWTFAGEIHAHPEGSFEI